MGTSLTAEVMVSIGVSWRCSKVFMVSPCRIAKKALTEVYTWTQFIPIPQMTSSPPRLKSSQGGTNVAPACSSLRRTVGVASAAFFGEGVDDVPLFVV
jgi:hypothetical protein